MKNRRNSLRIRRLIYAALYLAIALILPFLTGQIPEIGSMLCPMHIPVLLCGFVCGWPYGFAIGLISPILRSLLFGMPPLYPTAVAMMFELATYGAVAGVLYRWLPRNTGCVFAALIGAMLAGRIVWGVAQLVLLQIQGEAFSMAMFIAGAITSAVPGIVLHFILIPAVVIALRRAGLVLNGE